MLINLFGLFFRYCISAKCYLQVILTSTDNSQLLLQLEILDKLRLVTFHKRQHKETY